MIFLFPFSGLDPGLIRLFRKKNYMILTLRNFSCVYRSFCKN